MKKTATFATEAQRTQRYLAALLATRVIKKLTIDKRRGKPRASARGYLERKPRASFTTENAKKLKVEG